MNIPIVNTDQAIQLLRKGEVIAYPTETVYGLGADATNAQAVQKIFDLKGRSDQSPISVLVSSFEVLAKCVKPFPMRVQELMDQFWPGPLTLVFEAKENVFPQELLAGTGKIGIRMSSDPVAQELCKEFDLPLTTTSANPSGKVPARSVEEVQKYFDLGHCESAEGGRGNPATKWPLLGVSAPAGSFHFAHDDTRLAGIVDNGERNSKQVSTVLDVTSEPFKIIREGKISRAKLKGYL